jgi:hypothetical protein
VKGYSFLTAAATAATELGDIELCVPRSFWEWGDTTDSVDHVEAGVWVLVQTNSPSAAALAVRRRPGETASSGEVR